MSSPSSSTAGVPKDVPTSNPGSADDADLQKDDTRPITEYMVSHRPSMFEYSVVRSLFVQSMPEYLIDQQEFNDHYWSKNFGLMLYNDKNEPDWQAFTAKIAELNANAASDETYKVLYLARHGQVERYGHPKWEGEIGMLKEYKGLRVGPDPELTDTGKMEAGRVGDIWKTQIGKHSLSAAGAMPQKFYASPFTRALQTLEATWKDIVLNLPDVPKVYVKEGLRETIGRHYCDYRGDMRDIKKTFPWIELEEGMTDEDTIWTEAREDGREGGSMDWRVRDVLDDIFMNDGETFISITAHSGCLGCIMRVTGHRFFALETSRMVPLVVKAKLRPEFKDKKLPARVEGLPYNFTPAHLDST
ncbi:hypothetical protein AA313_de0200158 [Arthrobotrys entomopaga]|nr:hypothetical protein AA313_de0200158 [Arthrobotrys entomopaga]